jgi:hypothetical protein
MTTVILRIYYKIILGILSFPSANLVNHVSIKIYPDLGPQLQTNITKYTLKSSQAIRVAGE